MLYLLATTLSLCAQAPAKTPARPLPAVANPSQITAYDVVAIKPNHSGPGHVDIDRDLDTYRAVNVSVLALIEDAYGLHADQISGEPSWVHSARFDITAKIADADEATLRKMNREDRRRLLQSMLADQFHLRFHTETKTLPVYELVVAKDGPKFKQVAADASDKPFNGVSSGGVTTRNTHLTAHAVVMARLCDALSSRLERTVLDKTGLAGKYDFELIWTADDHLPSADAADSAPPPLITALQEQLGLKLQAARGSVPTLVVDHIEPPVDN